MGNKKNRSYILRWIFSVMGIDDFYWSSSHSQFVDMYLYKTHIKTSVLPTLPMTMTNSHGMIWYKLYSYILQYELHLRHKICVWFIFIHCKAHPHWILQSINHDVKSTYNIGMLFPSLNLNLLSTKWYWQL